MKMLYDETHRFAAGFNPDNGFYYRTNQRDGSGQDTGHDPFMASFPHLLDVGIMGHCTHGLSGRCTQSGIECYQSGASRYEDHMTLEDFRTIADQCAGRTFQFALGGRGDPDQHPQIEAILSTCREHEIVPNFTTSGWGLDEIKAQMCARYCGAVAVSWQRARHTLRAVDTLLDAGVTTNIHFVLDRRSIDEALKMLTDERFPPGINRVIFLLHKPIGQGSREAVLSIRDPKVAEFFALFNHQEYCEVAGFDSCSVPGLVNLSPRVHPASIETCEGARFSAYVTSDMKLLPCSFDQDQRWAADLRRSSIEDLWSGQAFEDFRERLRSSCPDCSHRSACLGGCPIDPSIVLCEQQVGGETT